MLKYDAAWAGKYLTEGHRKEIKRDEFFVYKERGKIIGVVSLITDVSGVAEIRDMIIKPEYRREGHGRKMLSELVELAKKRKIRKLYAFIFSRHGRLYESAGFEREGILKSHFAAGENLAIMSKFL